MGYTGVKSGTDTEGGCHLGRDRGPLGLGVDGTVGAGTYIVPSDVRWVGRVRKDPRG